LPRVPSLLLEAECGVRREKLEHWTQKETFDWATWRKIREPIPFEI